MRSSEIILRWRFVCGAIVLLPVGDSSLGRAVFEAPQVDLEVIAEDDTPTGSL